MDGLEGKDILTDGVTGIYNVLGVTDLLYKSCLWAQGQDCFFQFGF